MAIRLTESKLRQIIREEILSEAGTYFHPTFRRRFTYESNEGNLKARAFQSIYAERLYGNKLSFAIENAWWDIAGDTWKLRDLWNEIVGPIWRLRQDSLKWWGPHGDEETVHNNMESEIAAWKDWMQQASQLIGRDIVDATMEALAPTNKKKFQAFLNKAESSRSSAAYNLAAAEEYDRDLAAKSAAAVSPRNTVGESRKFRRRLRENADPKFQEYLKTIEIRAEEEEFFAGSPVKSVAKNIVEDTLAYDYDDVDMTPELVDGLTQALLQKHKELSDAGYEGIGGGESNDDSSYPNF